MMNTIKKEKEEAKQRKELAAIKSGENLSVKQKKKNVCTQRRRICKLKMALPV